MTARDEAGSASTTSSSGDPRQTTLDAADQARRSLRGLGNLASRIAPWLFEVGSWVFGGLIAVGLVVISALITVGPVDTAIRVSITAFACGLPLSVGGIVLLRLVKDMEDIDLEDLTLQSFREEGFPEIDAYFPPVRDKAARHERRSRVALGAAMGVALLSLALTLAGLAAALWHMAWWIAATFVAMVVGSAGLVIATLAYTLPPESVAEKALKTRYRAKRDRPR